MYATLSGSTASRLASIGTSVAVSVSAKYSLSFLTAYFVTAPLPALAFSRCCAFLCSALMSASVVGFWQYGRWSQYDAAKINVELVELNP